MVYMIYLQRREKLRLYLIKQEYGKQRRCHGITNVLVGSELECFKTVKGLEEINHGHIIAIFRSQALVTSRTAHNLISTTDVKSHCSKFCYYSAHDNFRIWYSKKALRLKEKDLNI